MVKEFIDSIFATWKQNPKALVVNILIVLVILFAVFSFFYSQQKDLLEKDYQTKKTSFDEILKTKDAQIELLDKQNTVLKDSSIQDKINNGAIDINISNSNNLDGNFANSIINASCKEKDFIIAELSTKINNQEKGLIACQQDNNDLQSKVNELQQQIPDYAKGFIGKDISVPVNSTFIADNGRFTLAVSKTESFASNGVFSFWTDFVLNGVGYHRNVGENVDFVYYDGNYTLTLTQTGNPSTFSIAKAN